MNCNELLELIENDGRFVEVPSIEENINLLREIIEDTNIELEYSISMTTRNKRDYEKEGVHYYFTDKN